MKNKNGIIPCVCVCVCVCVCMCVCVCAAEGEGGATGGDEDHFSSLPVGGSEEGDNSTQVAGPSLWLAHLGLTSIAR